DLAVNARGQLIEVVCIGWQRLKNAYNPTEMAKIIHHFRTADFEEASGALKSLIDGTNYAPKKYVSQATKNAILKKAAEKWKAQEFSVRKAYILYKNPAAKNIKDIRKWLEHEPEQLLERLGYINPVTGHIIDPDDFCFDRITDDSEYVFQRVLPISIPLNDAKSAGTSTNEFSSVDSLAAVKKRRGWEGVDDREAVCRLLQEFIRALVKAKGGFIEK
ncbi:hypothetical protein HDV05_002045, partial [Chytridiales sp. JEL 0842]